MGMWMGVLEDEGINNGIEYGGKLKLYLFLQICEIGIRISLLFIEGCLVFIYIVIVLEYFCFCVYLVVSVMYCGVMV